ncbi:MerR family transcriptional regulator [Niallia sp. 03133]|uniref:MerR family transcriptional regulator n=1 Tax=Niallia sp. 03133 TaxID=3458060 RepID=UPI00404483C1
MLNIVKWKGMKRLLSISEAAEKSGISPYTLRYYEKIGVLPPPKRKNGGNRFYTDSDVNFMIFLKSLKETGMSLDDIIEFVKEGCILEKIELEEDNSKLMPTIHKRVEILSKHLEKMEEKRRCLEELIFTTRKKQAFYSAILKEEDGK